jgi:hypothetical protein
MNEEGTMQQHDRQTRCARGNVTRARQTRETGDEVWKMKVGVGYKHEEGAEGGAYHFLKVWQPCRLPDRKISLSKDLATPIGDTCSKVEWLVGGLRKAVRPTRLNQNAKRKTYFRSRLSLAHDSPSLTIFPYSRLPLTYYSFFLNNSIY